MSFSFDVKDEIAQANLNEKKSFCCLYGMLLFAKSVTPDNITLLTENFIVAELFTKLVGYAVGNKLAVNASVIIKKNNISLFTLTVESKEDRHKLLEYFKIDNSKPLCIETEKFLKEKYYSFFVAGAFMVCGSINDPSKEYHLEFVTPDEILSEQLGKILSSFGIQAKFTVRKNSYIVYIKESENIEDLLTIMGASRCTLNLMNVKVEKEMRNKVNRAVNCDSANIEKALNASEKQIKNISLIENKIGIKSLPEELQEIAELRLANPDFNLKEISENLDPPISRSGANHRFIRLAKIAENL